MYGGWGTSRATAIHSNQAHSVRMGDDEVVFRGDESCIRRLVTEVMCPDIPTYLRSSVHDVLTCFPMQAFRNLLEAIPPSCTHCCVTRVRKKEAVCLPIGGTR